MVVSCIIKMPPWKMLTGTTLCWQRRTFVFVTSAPVFRRLCYQLFIICHILGYMVFFLAAA